MKFSLASIVVAATGVLGAFAAPSANSTELSARAGTPSSEGWHNGYFYSWWTDNQGTAYYNNLNNYPGQYSLQWSGNGNLVGGKGWNPGNWGRYLPITDAHIPGI